MGSKKSTSTTTTREVPDYISDASQQAVNLGTSIASRPYEGYSGQRYAGLDPNETQGINLAASSQGDAQSYVQKAGDALAGVKTFPNSDIKAYENPYTQDVLDPQIRDLNTSYGQQMRAMAPNLSAGSSGDILARSSLQKNLLQGISDTTGKGRAAAFDSAMSAWSGDQDRQLRAADAWRQTGGQVQQMNTQQIRDLMTTGGAARAVAQLDKDFDYQQFVEARDWDVNNLGPLLESLKVPYDTTSTSTTKTKGNVVGQILGMATTAAGAYYGSKGKK